MKTNILFLTTAPHGTLGDVAAARIVINALLAQYSDMSITWFVQAEEGVIKVPALMQFDPLYDKRIQCSVIKKFELSVLNTDGILASYQLVITCPFVHGLTDTFYLNLKLAKMPYISILEYDDHHAGKYKEAIEKSLLNETKMPGRELYYLLPMGLAEEHQGLLFSQPFELDDDSDLLSQLEIFGIKSGDFYFAYFNSQRAKLSNKLTHEKFIAFCMEKQKGKVNIIINLPVSEYEALIKQAQDKFNIHIITVEEGEYKTLAIGSQVEGLPTAVIHTHFFPLSPGDFQWLMKNARPPIGVTGDQSVTQAIQFRIPFIYQAMSWKEDFFLSLVFKAEKKNKEGKYLFDDFHHLLLMPMGNGQHAFVDLNIKKIQSECDAFSHEMMAECNATTRLIEHIGFVLTTLYDGDEAFARALPSIQQQQLLNPIYVKYLKRFIQTYKVELEPRIQKLESLLLTNPSARHTKGPS